MNPTYKLILLDTPIIVSSEEIIGDDYYYHFINNEYYKADIEDIVSKDIKHCKKVISGLPKQKPIDWNGFEKELGSLNFDSIFDEYTENRLEGMCNSHYWDVRECKNDFRDGFNTHKQLSDKKFSESDMIEAIGLARIEHKVKYSENDYDYDFNTDEIITKISQPKQFQIEVEETETSFKIVKVLWKI